MPGGDRTGPIGAGPRTGRAAGFCAGYGMPGYANPGFGRGFGRGYGSGFGFGRGFGGGGYGRGRGNRFFATGIPGRGRGWGGWFAPAYGYSPGYAPSPYYEDERAALRDEAEYLKSALDDINRRLDEIQAKKEGG
jgi:hypothetical protein